MAGERKHTAHTPGPWTVDRSKMATDGAFDYAISADGAPVIAEAFGRDAKGGWPAAEANARLIASAPALLEALEAAAEKFAEYARIHRGKHTVDGDAKAVTNDQMAAMCRAAINRARATGGEG